MAHSGKNPAKAWNPPAQKAPSPARAGTWPAARNALADLRPSWKNWSEACALGELYAVHTLAERRAEGALILRVFRQLSAHQNAHGGGHHQPARPAEESPRQCRPRTLVFSFSSIFTRLE